MRYYVASFGFSALIGSVLLASCAAPIDSSDSSPETESIGEVAEAIGEESGPMMGEASAEDGEVSAEAAAFCQCTTYVHNRFSLSAAYPNAQNWGPYLTGQGYVKVANPAVGDIVVYTATRMANCCGHVGVIASVGATLLSVRGANQGGSATQFGCNNVSTNSFNRKATGESYYRKSVPSGPWCSANCGGGGWWCTGDSTCIVNGVAGHNYHCPGNNTAPDVDQACPSGCVNAPAGSPDYCKPSNTSCGSGAWCGNDCVGGFAKTLYTFSGSTVASVKHCQVGYANHTCVTAPAGTADYCN